MSRAINVILTENQAQTLSSVPPIFLFHPYLAASLEASLCHYLSEEPRLLLASPGPLSQMSQRAASTPYKAWTILFYCKHHPAKRCDLRLGSKRTENFPKHTEKLKSHEARGGMEEDDQKTRYSILRINRTIVNVGFNAVVYKYNRECRNPNIEKYLTTETGNPPQKFNHKCRISILRNT